MIVDRKGQNLIDSGLAEPKVPGMIRDVSGFALKAPLLVLVFVLASFVDLKAEPSRFPPVVAEPNLFSEALAKERPGATNRLPVTGITVPHHLLAADLIARGVWAAAGNSYDRIVVISPDHFRRSHRPLATTRRGFETAMGPVDVDQAAAEILIDQPDLVEDSDLFAHEHGITGLLPFLHAVFPDTPVVPVTLGIGTDRTQWDAAVELLKKIVSKHTLVVQSTDYSHYLLPPIARARDQETLNVIAADDAEAVAGLQQSNHLDSKAAQYVQMRLQHDVFDSSGAVVANRNSSEYLSQDAPSTSYVVTVYASHDAALSRLVYPDQTVTYFGGDVFLGRWFTPLLIDDETRGSVVDGVRRLTAGQALIVNLEGVITAAPPTGVPQQRHVMDDGLAGPILQALNIRAAGLANNHSFDLGADGLAASELALKGRGIRPVPHMTIADIGAFRLVALNFIGSGDFKGYPVVRQTDRRGEPLAMTDITRLCHLAARPPLIALVHWGTEYTSVAGAREREIGRALAACGISLIVGAHSHMASPKLELVAGGESLMFYSLGNLLFDQRGPRGSGALVELRVFKQGTIATRVIRAPNFYDAAAAR